MAVDGLNEFLRAGKMAAEVRDKTAAKVAVGVPAMDVARFCDSLIEELGGKPAFPINISINEIAAHYTPVEGDGVAFKEGDVVKIDVGVHVDGYPADTAVTVSLASPLGAKLKDAAEAALAAAEKVLRPGAQLPDIGAAVEAEITGRGFKPIYNLTGHTMERWNLHAGISVPNYKGMKGTLPADCAVAIEPFATTGDGYVSDGPPSRIFALTGRPTRLPQGKALLASLLGRFSTLPFTSRWLSAAEAALLEHLVKSGAVHNYPILREASRAPVAQAEHTFLISGDEVLATTK